MKSIHSYLSFGGNCRQAMKFYQSCLGGELSFQYVGDTPLAAKMPARMKKCILQAILRSDTLTLFGSDMVADSGLIQGNSISLLLNCRTQTEIRTCYKNLSQSGRQTHPLKQTYSGAIFGGLTDRFGNHWLLSYEKKLKKQE